MTFNSLMLRDYSGSTRDRHDSFSRSVIVTLSTFVLVNCGLTLVGAGGVVRYLFPASAFLIGYYLVQKARYAYVSFVWWTTFLSPLVRRVVDYRSGWVDHNWILLTPLLVVLAGLPSVISAGIPWQRKTGLPFVLAIASVSYGFILGFLDLPKSVWLQVSMGWIVPIVFGLYMYSVCTDEKQVSGYSSLLTQTFVLGTFVMGLYGAIQFVTPSGWDAFWMVQVGLETIGSPEPFQVRVFSTMNAPGPFAFLISAGVLLSSMNRGRLASLASTLGWLALLLSGVRSAWLAWLVAFVTIRIQQRRNCLGILVLLGFLGVLIFCPLDLGPIQQTIQSRLSSFADLQGDTSFQERRSGSEQILQTVLSEPLGMGLGTMDFKFSGNSPVGARDSGVIDCLLSLGWVGGAIYLSALGCLAWLAIRPGFRRSQFEVTASAVCLGLLSQIFLGSVMLGTTGMVIWGFAGVSLASQTLKKPSCGDSLIAK